MGLGTLKKKLRGARRSQVGSNKQTRVPTRRSKEASQEAS
jgi:hypothetical protein